MSKINSSPHSKFTRSRSAPPRNAMHSLAVRGLAYWRAERSQRDESYLFGRRDSTTLFGLSGGRSFLVVFEGVFFLRKAKEGG
jgi:hypothetical protein